MKLPYSVKEEILIVVIIAVVFVSIIFVINYVGMQESKSCHQRLLQVDYDLKYNMNYTSLYSFHQFTLECSNLLDLKETMKQNPELNNVYRDWLKQFNENQRNSITGNFIIPMAYAVTQEFDYENCRTYFFERNIFIPYEILMHFEEAKSGGFFYESSNPNYSYWIEKPEEHSAIESTFMGVGSNSTERVEWQFNTNYDTASVDGREFSIEVISAGESILRNTFKDSGKDICTILNFNTDIKPVPLTTDQLIDLGLTATKDEINNVRSEMRKINGEQVQSNNYSGIFLLVVTVAVILIFLNGKNESRKVRLLRQEYLEMLEKGRDDKNFTFRTQQYYELKINETKSATDTRLKYVERIVERFRDLEPMINNFHYILDYLKKENNPVIKGLIVTDSEPFTPATEFKEDDVSLSKMEQLTNIFDFKKKQVSPDSNTSDYFYEQYKHDIAKLSKQKKLDYISAHWKKNYVLPDIQDPASEFRLRIDALHRLDSELRN